MNQKSDKLYRSAPLEKIDFEQRLEKKLNDVNSFNNHINNINEINDYLFQRQKQQIKKEI